MNGINNFRNLLGSAVVSAALLVMTSPGAFADAPGYLFLDLTPAAHSVAGVPTHQSDGPQAPATGAEK